MKLATVLSSFFVATLACGPSDDNAARSSTPVDAAPPPQPAPPSAPPASPPSSEPVGDIGVTTETSGTDLDPDGYSIYVDGYWDYVAPITHIAPNGTVVIRNVIPGAHTLTLFNLSQNCNGDHLRDLPIVVHADSVVNVTFHVVCKAITR